MSQWVVIPTYNEKENIPSTVQGVFLHLPSAHLLVVDDNSPDGTGGLVEDLKSQYGDRLHCLHRKVNKGYGPSCLEGFRFALDHKAQKIIQMDADASHPVEVLPQLLEISEQYDLTLGSRYVSGGGTLDWPYRRRLLSRSANFYARTMLGLPIRDVTTGFRCFNRNVLDNLDLKSINSVGYGFLTEMVFVTYFEGFSIGEYPIIYRDRTLGSSKMGLHIAGEGALQVLKLRLKMGYPQILLKPHKSRASDPQINLP